MDEVLGEGVAEVRWEGRVVAHVDGATVGVRPACLRALPDFDAAVVPEFVFREG